MLEELKRQVLQANLMLRQYHLAVFTWGNASGVDRTRGLAVIKPSGIAYDAMGVEDLVVVSLETGERVEGKWKPSSDTRTHLELYRAFPAIGGVVHTHSAYATAWAQAGEDLPCYGTTHADTFYGPIPCTRLLMEKELGEYEKNTGAVIVETFRERGIAPSAVPAVLCAGHGPFAWGQDAVDAAEHAAVLEEVAKMAVLTRQVNPQAVPAPRHIVDKHYFRKHGPDAYYGQL